MSGESPVSVLFSSDGYELSAINGNSIPSNTRGLLVEGSDGTNSRFISVDTSGRVVLVGAGTAGAGTGGVLTIQGNASGTPVPVSGTVTATNASVSTTAAVAPGSATYAGALVTTSVQSGLTNADMYALNMTTTGLLRVDGSNVTQPVSGTVTANAGTGSFTVAQATAANLNATVVGVGTAGTPSGGVLTIQGSASGTPIPISGSITATNASVGATGATPPTSASLSGGSVTTSAPTYTTGQMNALSLNTSGGLRVDGSGVTQPVSIASAVTVAQATAASLNATVVGSGNFTVVQPTAASLNATVVGTGTGGAVSVAQATAANLNATVVGTTAAGSGASSGLITVQGNAAGTPIPTVNTLTDTTSTGSLGALNAAVTIAVTGQNNAAMQLVAGTLIGTIVAEVSVDGGTTWTSTFFDDPSTSNITSSITFGSSNTATTRTIVAVGGASNVRVRVSAYTSGTATANLRASFMQDASFLSGGAAGSVLPPVINQAGASVTTSAPSYTTGTLNALSLNTSGGLRVDGSGVTQPVSGTITANAGTGSFTVVQSTAASLNATVIGSGNFNVVGTGTAGTPAGGVLSIQGVSGGTAIPVSGTVTATNASVSTTGSAPPGSATYAGASVTTSAPSYTTGQMSALSLNTSGGLRVDGSGVTQPVSIASAVTVAQATAASLNATVVGTGTGGAVSVAQATAANLNATVVGSGNFTVVQPTAASLNATIVGTTAAGSGASSGLVTVQGNASGTPIPVSGSLTVEKSTTGTMTSVAAATTSTSILASNAARVSASFYNDTTSSILYLALSSSAASTTSYTIKVMPNSYFDLPVNYTGAINGIWNNASGSVRVTEYT